jgi:hypothetical protein
LCDTLPKCKNTLGRALSHRQVHEKIIAEQWSCAMILAAWTDFLRRFFADV